MKQSRLRTLGHQRAVDRIVWMVGRGENVFHALPLGYRAVEACKRTLVPDARPRREERTEIYDEAQRMLGERALFSVALMWAFQDDSEGRLTGMKPPVGVQSRLVAEEVRSVFPSIDYEQGAQFYRSHYDLVIVTHRDGASTGANLNEYMTRLHVAHSLMFGEEPGDDYRRFTQISSRGQGLI